MLSTQIFTQIVIDILKIRDAICLQILVGLSISASKRGKEEKEKKGKGEKKNRRKGEKEKKIKDVKEKKKNRGKKKEEKSKKGNMFGGD